MLRAPESHLQLIAVMVFGHKRVEKLVICGYSRRRRRISVLREQRYCAINIATLDQGRRLGLNILL